MGLSDLNIARHGYKMVGLPATSWRRIMWLVADWVKEDCACYWDNMVACFKCLRIWLRLWFMSCVFGRWATVARWRMNEHM